MEVQVMRSSRQPFWPGVKITAAALPCGSPRPEVLRWFWLCSTLLVAGLGPLSFLFSTS